jgi:hypothetical protein
MKVAVFTFVLLAISATIAPIGWMAVNARTPGLRPFSQAELPKILGGECYDEDWTNPCGGHSASCWGANPQCSLVNENMVCNQGGQYGWIQAESFTNYPTMVEDCDGFFDFVWGDFAYQKEQLCSSGCTHFTPPGQPDFWACDGGVQPPATRGADFHYMEFGWLDGCDECGG